MDDGPELDDTLRPEYDLSQLSGGIRGKYYKRYWRPPNRVFLFIAITCGAVPLAVGSLIYFTWLVTRWSWLEGAGIVNIFAGLFLFVIGAVCLCVYVARGRRDASSGTKRAQVYAVLVGGLLLANFPAAAVYGLSAIYLLSHYHVLVSNDSDETIDSFTLRSPAGIEVELGPLRAGANKSRYLAFHGDGNLEFDARQQQLHFGGEIEGYVTGNMNGDTAVYVKNGGEFEVHHYARTLYRGYETDRQSRRSVNPPSMFSTLPVA